MKTGYRESQVVIAGGGVAGFNAAIASARAGADTLLIERHGFLGGMFTGWNVAVLMAQGAALPGRSAELPRTTPS